MTAAGYRTRRQARPVLMLMGVGEVCVPGPMPTLTAAFLSCVDRGRPTVACFMLCPHRLAALTRTSAVLLPTNTLLCARLWPARPASAGDP
jgi:hypothetical protein